MTERINTIFFEDHERCEMDKDNYENVRNIREREGKDKHAAN
ncbi:hypothetical protein ACM26V_17160 [Salipaludibacillus sp. HK11]